MRSTPLAAVAVPVLAAALASGCEGADEHEGTRAPPAHLAKGSATIRACGGGVGGYRVRAAGLGCPAARRFVRRPRIVRELREYRFRDPDAQPVEVSREVVSRTVRGWTCLAQALPRVRVTQFLCVRGDRVVLWRFS